MAIPAVSVVGIWADFPAVTWAHSMVGAFTAVSPHHLTSAAFPARFRAVLAQCLARTGLLRATTFVPRQNSYASYRSPNGAGNRGGWTRPGRDHNLRYRRPYTGSGYGSYPYLYSNSWELLPWDIGYPDYTGYDEDYESTQSNNGQVQPSGEEQQQQQPESEGYRPEYVPAPYESSANRTAPSPPPSNEPQLTLIFKDGHTQTIRNYVLTPSEVIVMDDASSGRIPRISLSELNLPATEKAANQAGLDFSPPSA